jgi:hypothetical protein
VSLYASTSRALGGADAGCCCCGGHPCEGCTREGRGRDGRLEAVAELGQGAQGALLLGGSLHGKACAVDGWAFVQGESG